MECRVADTGDVALRGRAGETECSAGNGRVGDGGGSIEIDAIIIIIGVDDGAVGEFEVGARGEARACVGAIVEDTCAAAGDSGLVDGQDGWVGNSRSTLDVIESAEAAGEDASRDGEITAQAVDVVGIAATTLKGGPSRRTVRLRPSNEDLDDLLSDAGGAVRIGR